MEHRDPLCNLEPVTVVASLAREAAGPPDDARSVLTRMIRAAAPALPEDVLALSIEWEGREVRVAGPTEDPDPPADSRPILELPLHFLHSRTGVLRCVPLGEPRERSAAERAFLDAVAGLLVLAFDRHAPSGSWTSGPTDSKEEGASGLTGRSSPMRQVILDVRRAARLPGGILITGEAGTGKKRVARAIHELSTARRGPFMVVTCSMMSEPLLDRELFGTSEVRRGLLSLCRRGTLVLEEIGDLSPLLQRRLLPWLRDSGRPGNARDLRIIGTSRQNLALLVASGALRPEFYAGMASTHLHLPPLRDRLEDVPPLAELFLSEICGALGKERKRLDPSLMKRLVNHPWPGNARELRDVLQRAILDAPGVVLESAELSSETRGPSVPSDERQRIESALEVTRGNRTAAAKLLGMSRVTLWKRLKSMRTT